MEISSSSESRVEKRIYLKVKLLPTLFQFLAGAFATSAPDLSLLEAALKNWVGKELSFLFLETESHSINSTVPYYYCIYV